MIKYHDGGVFTAAAHSYVIPVNTVGVMGKGLALEAKIRFPRMFLEYQKVCALGALQPGQLMVYDLLRDDGHSLKPHYTLICLPTKRDWRYPSRLSDVEAGLSTLFDHCKELGRIAIPKLGCGNGQLDWESQVHPLVKQYFNKRGSHLVVCLGATNPVVRLADHGPYRVSIL